MPGDIDLINVNNCIRANFPFSFQRAMIRKKKKISNMTSLNSSRGFAKYSKVEERRSGCIVAESLRQNENSI